VPPQFGARRGRVATAWGRERACRRCLGAREGAAPLPEAGERAPLLLGAGERVTPLPGG